VVIVIFSKAYIIMCEVGYVRQYNVPPLSFHITLITILTFSILSNVNIHVY
jgi:hypothetical protein